jgi:hypothetical protein
MGIGAHQRRNRKARNDSGNRAANRHLIGNDEVFKVDKGGDDKNRNENPVGDCNLPRKSSPNCEEEKRGDQFYAEIAKRNPASAVRAPLAQYEPTDQR